MTSVSGSLASGSWATGYSSRQDSTALPGPWGTPLGWLGAPHGALPCAHVGPVTGGAMHAGTTTTPRSHAAPELPQQQDLLDPLGGKVMLWSEAYGGEAQAAAIAPKLAKASRVPMAE